MPQKLIGELIDQQRGWLDPLGRSIANSVQQTASGAGATGAKVVDFLHGVWLGHPLHAAVTDLPVGAWTVAAVLDAVDTFAPNEGVRRCADGAVALGTLGGLAAAPAGLADWHHLMGHDRRVGLVHGLMNAGITAMYGLSLALRRGQTRPVGVSLGFLAYALAGVSAYLGGELVYGSGVGVDHIAWEPRPKDWVRVLAEDELEENKPREVQANGMPVMLVKRHGHLHALANTCTHLGGPLAEGSLADDEVVCPWHGSRFALEDGKVKGGPATFDELAFDVRVRDGQIEIKPRR